MSLLRLVLHLLMMGGTNHPMPKEASAMNDFPLSYIGSTELEARVGSYTAEQISAEIERCQKQAKLDETRVGLRSTPEFWQQREMVLRRALGSDDLRCAVCGSVHHNAVPCEQVQS